MSFKLPDLSYDYSALEPHIDARTMEIHHSKHHGGYTTKLNGAIEGTDLEGKSIEDILAGVSSASTAVRNNGGGYYNHNLFWEVMGPNGGGEPLANFWMPSTAISVLLPISEKNSVMLRQPASDRAGPGW